jgi:hypothetical protein
MRFIYATRPIPKLDFATADQLDAVPLGAEVVAVCDGAMTIRRDHCQSLSTLSDQEQTALDELILESQAAEAAVRVCKTHEAGFFVRLFRRLLTI